MRRRIALPCRRGWRGFVLALGLSALAPAAWAEGVFRVCLDENNLPYSARNAEQGFDIGVSQAVARQLGRRWEPSWYTTDARIQEIDDSDLPTRRLARGECDAIFSFPGPAADTLRGETDLTLGAAYYGAAFELLSCGAEVPPQFRALRGHTVAIQSQTVAHFALLMVKAEPRNYFSLDAALSGVTSGETEAALLWGPSVGHRLRPNTAESEACRFVPGYEPPTAVRWNLHVANRAADEALKTRIAEALTAVADSGELETLAGAWGIPWHPPFDSTYSMGAINELKRSH